MECPHCGRYEAPDPETGYDSPDLCPSCQRDGWEMTDDGELLQGGAPPERERGDDDGVEYADPADELLERLR